MARQVLIIHGWSDNSDSFHPLARFLQGNGYDAQVIWLGDYVSKDDDVRVQDVAIRMAEVIDARIAAGKLARSFDVIVHSTGGLVARAWLTTHYAGAAERCPMKRLVMLAPANYGSKLAATGKSMLGRLFKGYDNWFQTGQSMLEDLELSSPFQWELAQRDVLVAPGAGPAQYYGEDRVWPFVITGTHGYTSALRRLANEEGSDGTVRVSAANLNARGVTIDFRERDEQKMMQLWGSRLACNVPLAVLPTRTHGSVIDPLRSDKDNHEEIAETATEKQALGRLILEALACPDFDGYRSILERWDGITEATAARASADPENPDSAQYHQYMQVNTYVVDDHGKPVADYFLEFFSNRDKAHDDANVYLHANVLEDVKKNSVNEALRNLYFDRTDLVEGYYPRLPAGTPPRLFMSIAAAAPGENISYFEPGDPEAKGMVQVHLEGDRTRRWLRRNSTHFVQIIIPRRPIDKVFRLKTFEG